MLIGVCRIGGFGFDFKNAGFTFVYVSGRQLIAFDFGLFDLDYLVRNLHLEYEWLQFVSLTNEVLDVETVSWSAYHSSKKRSGIREC
jgi:hypothetical protein